MRAIVPRLLARSLLSSFSGSVHTTRRAMASTEHNSVEGLRLLLLLLLPQPYLALLTEGCGFLLQLLGFPF